MALHLMKMARDGGGCFGHCKLDGQLPAEFTSVASNMFSVSLKIIKSHIFIQNTGKFLPSSRWP
jgi:hypothetical protein